MMLHHNPHYLRCQEDDRRAAAARRRLPADAGDLERTLMAAASRNSSAWNVLVERFGARVRGAARRYGLGPHDVDDVAQATWLSLFEHIDDLREPQAIGSWLETTARRESLRVLRNGGRERLTDGELVGPEPVQPVNERRLVDADRRRALEAGLEQLPERQRELITMMLCEPAPEYREISRSLGIPQGSIGPTRQRGLARLREDRELALLCRD